MTKDFFDMKRSLATATNTTFVYDFPDMFKIGVKHLWKQLCPEGAQQQPPRDEELFSAKQLILSPDESKVRLIFTQVDSDFSF